MNDAQALTAIRAALDEYFRGQTNPYEALNKVAYITGLNGGTK
jgi:hypothetical protein